MQKIWWAMILLGSLTLLGGCSSNPCNVQCQQACYDARKTLSDQLEQQHIKVAELIGKVVVIIPSDDLFNLKSDHITKLGHYQLTSVVAYLNTYPRGQFVVRAYTDKTLPYALRHTLSDKQARLVAGYLWTQNIPATYQALDYAGKGGAESVDNNKNYLGTENNRRVEITIDPHCALSGKGFVK